MSDTNDFLNLVLTYTRGESQRAAEKFGLNQALLEAGHAYGYNIVTGVQELPTFDVDAVYLRVAGIEAQFLLDAASYAWDANGIVVSTDLLLVGVTGYTGSAPPASSWVRLPVPASALRPAPTAEVDIWSRANSGPIPSGFNPADPASVAAALATLATNGVDRYGVGQEPGAVVISVLSVLEDSDLSTGGVAEVIDYPYQLVLPGESLTVTTGPTVAAREFSPVPPVRYELTGHAPTVSLTGTPRVPVTRYELEAHRPVIRTGNTVDVPVVAYTLTAHAPDRVGDSRLRINVPVAAYTLTAHAPTTVGPRESGSYWDSWVAQNYGWQVDIFPDGWAG
jgi:hypothetical protein